MWKSIITVAPSEDHPFDVWHDSEDGNREYHVDPNATELKVSDFLRDHDPRLSFRDGLSALPLEKLSLEGAALAAFPSVFIRCQKLMEIHCSSVGLYTLPRMFGSSDLGLHELKKLNLSNNNLKNIPTAIRELSKLKELDISNNWLSTLPNEIWNLSNLEVLHVEDNILIALPDKHMGNMKKLRHLDCSNNKLSDTCNMPEGLLCLPTLERICLYGNAFLPKLLICKGPPSEKHWEVDMHSGTIRKKTTGGCIEFTPDKFYVISNMLRPTLTSLKLSQCNLLFVPKRIMELESLKKLDLSNSSFCKLPDDIGRLKNLRTLDISNNDRLKYVPDDLIKCTKLKKVVVKDCLYCEELLGSIDKVFEGKSVHWKDRPPLLPKLIIKALVCSALLLMSFYTIYVNMKDNKNNEKSVNDMKGDENMQMATEEPQMDDNDTGNSKLYWFKCFASVFSCILLIPHAIDVGTMMDHFLQVLNKKKLHKILDLQDKLADRIDFPAVLRHNFWGLFSSFTNLFCFFWCTRPWDLEDGLSQADRTTPLSLEIFCASPIQRFKAIFQKRPSMSGAEWMPMTKLEYFVILVEWIDTFQTLMLFPLTVSVICSSENVNDVFVNVVAASVFARLDDEAVELFTKPQASLVERWCLYTGSGDDLKRSGVIEIQGAEIDDEDPYISSTSFKTRPSCKEDLGDESIAADTLQSFSSSPRSIRNGIVSSQK